MSLRPLLLLATLAGLAGAQPSSAPAARVHGVVHDSLAGRPLSGATVQLVDPASPTRAARTTTTDSLGRFALDAVAAGRYALGFFHPVLDSLGVEAPLRAVVVEGASAVRTDLALPSAARFRTTVCGASPEGAAGVVVGFLRSAGDGTPVAGGTVAGEWLEYALARGRIGARVARVTTATAPNGWFALCGTPSSGTVVLVAVRGTDSTARVEVAIPPAGFVRRSLWVGPASVARVDSAHVDGTRVAGTVVTEVGGRPLAGAQIGIVGGPQTRANEHGEWTLGGAPLGTRMLEVRAVGYYPVRRPVDVVADAAPMRVALATLRSVLDTVRISARARRFHDTGFDDRRRSGAGRYITASDVRKRNPIRTSDLFNSLPGLGVERDAYEMDDAIVMRRYGNSCTPAFYVDGHFMATLTTGELDTMMRPGEIAGIEIYSDTSAPMQFRPFVASTDLSAFVDTLPVATRAKSHRGDEDLGGCGSVVIWTR